jgi:hypothetical protein
MGDRNIATEIAMGMTGVYDGSVGSNIGNIVSGEGPFGHRKPHEDTTSARILERATGNGSASIGSIDSEKLKTNNLREVADQMLANYGAHPFGEIPGKMTLDDLSTKGNRPDEKTQFITVSDLAPEEGGFTTAWSVDRNDPPIYRTPGGTCCIPIWKDKNGEVHWDQSKVDEYISDRDK